MQQAVVSIQVTGGGQALDYSRGFVVKKLCSQTDVAAARLSVLTEKCELSNYPFQVLLSNSAASGSAQKCSAGEAVSLSLHDLLDSYGKPLFLTYVIAAPAPASKPTVNAFSRLMSAAQQPIWRSTPSKGISKRLDLQCDRRC